MNKKILLVGGVLFAAVLFAGCTLSGSSAPAPSADVNATLSGSLSEGAGGIFLLKTTEKGVVQLHDAGAKLEGFVGKNVSVTGQYSGTTLYVDKVVSQ